MTPNEIRELRFTLGMSQAQFAERLQVGRETVSCWENGRQRPNMYHDWQLRRLVDDTKVDKIEFTGIAHTLGSH